MKYEVDVLEKWFLFFEENAELYHEIMNVITIV